MAAIAAGVSMRRYGSTLEELPPSEKARAVSKRATSRRFVALSAEQLQLWLSAPLHELDLPVVMIDGIHFHERLILVALGIDADGHKHVPGLREGSTERTRVVRSLLSDLIERGLDADRARLWVIDGGKALRRAIVECFPTTALIQRCQEHKRRNVIDHLPDEMQASVTRAMRDAWDGNDVELAKKRLQRLASSLHAKHPSAAPSLRERLEETLTLQALGVTGALYRTLRMTNPIENLNGSIARYTRNVKRWRDGQITLRWIASAFSDAKHRFRKLRGYRELKPLLAALEKHIVMSNPLNSRSRSITTMSRHPASFNSGRDIAFGGNSLLLNSVPRRSFRSTPASTGVSQREPQRTQTTASLDIRVGFGARRMTAQGRSRRSRAASMSFILPSLRLEDCYRKCYRSTVSAT
jgi:transposase-like protein